jgi:hypothetical protein
VSHRRFFGAVGAVAVAVAVAAAASTAGAQPELIGARAWLNGPEWGFDLSLTGPVTVEARDISGATVTIVMEFDQPLLAYRSLEVTGGAIEGVAFQPGDHEITVQVSGATDISHVIARVVDAVSDTGTRPETRAQFTVLGADLAPNGRIDVFDAAELMSGFRRGDLRLDMNLDGSVDVFDAGYVFDRLTLGAYTLENLPPTITPVSPQHAEPGSMSPGAAFIVRDDRLWEHELSVWATSGDGSIVAAEDIEILGDGGERTVRFVGMVGADGSTTLTLHVSDGEHETTTSFPALVGPDTAPTAQIDADTYLGVAPLAVSFDASRSIDEQGNIAGYAWDFGGQGASSGQDASFTFTQPGEHAVTCTVTDASGLSDTATIVVTVADAPWDPASPVTEAEARRFLWQAGFGPSDADVAFIVASGFEAWIDAQIAETPSYITEAMLDHLDSLPNRWKDPSNLWEAHCVQGPDQLRQRVAWALIQVIPVRSGGGGRRRPLQHLRPPRARGPGARGERQLPRAARGHHLQRRHGRLAHLRGQPKG